MIVHVTVQLENPRLETLSPSRAGDFKTCPQLFKFRAIDRRPEPTSIYQARGTTAHLALQRLFDDGTSDRTPERLFDLFREAWTEIRGEEEFEDLFETTEEEREWGVESLKLLANYFSIEDPKSFDPEDRELDMLEDLDGIVIRGILDRIDRDEDGQLIITDYKTGKAPPERYALSAFFALKIYALVDSQADGRDTQRGPAALSERPDALQPSNRRSPTRRHGQPAQSIVERDQSGPRERSLPDTTGSSLQLVFVPGHLPGVGRGRRIRQLSEA